MSGWNVQERPQFITLETPIPTKLKFGLLLPHFCEHAAILNCLEGAKRAEDYGFDSVWVRDHLVFEPHGIEGGDNSHIEGMLVLAAIAAVTETISLGTSMAICHRHPIHLAQLFAGLSQISRGRVTMGIGLGGFPHEFAAAGYPTGIAARGELVRSNVEICRRLWTGERVSFKDDYFDFTDVALIQFPQDQFPSGTAAARRRRAAARSSTVTVGCRRGSRCLHSGNSRIIFANFARRLESR